MEKKPNGHDCILSGSPHCALLNYASCDKCYVSKLSREEQLGAGEDIFFIADALPEGGAESIRDSKTCALCRTKNGEEAGEATRYAQIDLGHKHPLFPDGEKTGRKYDRATSMVIPVQLPVCDSCRKRLNMLYYLPLTLGVLCALAGLVLTSLEKVRTALAQYGRVLPFLVFLIFVFLGVIVECVVKKALSVRIERTMNTRAKRIPALADLIKRGWFVIGAEDGMLPFTFIRERLPYGILTGDDQKAKLNSVRALGSEGALVLKQRYLEKQKQNKKAE